MLFILSEADNCEDSKYVIISQIGGQLATISTKNWAVLAFQKVFSPVQSFCRNDIFVTFPRTSFSHFISPKPPQKPGEIYWYPRKWGSKSEGTFYIPEWMTPNTSHNNEGKLCYDIPGVKPHYIYQYMACLGESCVNHDFALFFFTREHYFHKNPRISDIFPVQ